MELATDRGDHELDTKIALVYGYKGQDGQLLTKSLTEKGISVVGIGRENIEYISAKESDVVRLGPKIPDRQIFDDVRPDSVYYLAANHSSSEGNHASALLSDDFKKYFNSNLEPYVSVLEAALEINFDGPIFFASSSQVFGPKSGDVITEESPYHPSSLYGMAKAQSTWLGRKYRDEHSLQVYTGILFNHESALRPPSFLVPKIINTARRISEGADEVLEIGDPEARVDWSLASDFVSSFQDLVASGSPGEYIFASGERHSVKDLAITVFQSFGLDANRHIVQKPGIIGGPVSPLGNADIKKLRDTVRVCPKKNLQAFVAQLLHEYDTPLL